VQSKQLRKLQLARGGFGLVKDQHASQRMEEIMVSNHKYTMQKKLTGLTIGSAVSLETRDQQKWPKYGPRRICA
jgi:hypothetical protein